MDLTDILWVAIGGEEQVYALRLIYELLSLSR
jgi:hypothetical protein